MIKSQMHGRGNMKTFIFHTRDCVSLELDKQETRELFYIFDELMREIKSDKGSRFNDTHKFDSRLIENMRNKLFNIVFKK